MQPKLLEIYELLLEHFGAQHWWPGESPLEVMVGAVLAQNTSWTNAARAIAELRQAGLLSLEALEALPPEVLALHLRSAGYYNLKTVRLRNLLALIRREYEGDLAAFFGEEPGRLRERLLEVKGIGPETADSILLYAAEKPIFVVDAYTYRVLVRHGLIPEEADYHEIQTLFMDGLPAEVALYNEYHALLVRLGKEFCRKTKPRCEDCPLQGV